MVKATKGVLIECDASIKSIIVSINEESHDIIIEDLDDEHVVVHEGKLAQLKHRLNETLRDTVSKDEDSGSD